MLNIFPVSNGGFFYCLLLLAGLPRLRLAEGCGGTKIVTLIPSPHQAGIFGLNES